MIGWWFLHWINWPTLNKLTYNGLRNQEYDMMVIDHLQNSCCCKKILLWENNFNHSGYYFYGNSSPSWWFNYARQRYLVRLLFPLFIKRRKNSCVMMRFLLTSFSVWVFLAKNKLCYDMMTSYSGIAQLNKYSRVYF